MKQVKNLMLFFAIVCNVASYVCLAVLAIVHATNEYTTFLGMYALLCLCLLVWVIVDRLRP